MFKDIRKQRKYIRLYMRAYRAKKKAEGLVSEELKEIKVNGWNLK